MNKSIDEQINDILDGVDWCESCKHPRCIARFKSKQEAIKALINQAVREARLDEWDYIEVVRDEVDAAILKCMGIRLTELKEEQ